MISLVYDGVSPKFERRTDKHVSSLSGGWGGGGYCTF